MAMFAPPKKKGFDWTGAVLGAFNPQAAAMYHQKKAGRAESELEASAAQDAYTAFRRAGMGHEEAATAARDPQVRAHIIRDRSGFHTQNSVDMLSGKDIYMPTEKVIDDINVRTGSDGRSQATFESPYAKVIPGPDGSFMEQPRLGVGGINGIMAGDRPGAPTGMPRVNSEADIEALPPGSPFIAPDGSVRTKPAGGPMQPASGGFPSGIFGRRPY